VPLVRAFTSAAPNSGTCGKRQQDRQGGLRSHTRVILTSNQVRAPRPEGAAQSLLPTANSPPQAAQVRGGKHTYHNAIVWRVLEFAELVVEQQRVCGTILWQGTPHLRRQGGPLYVSPLPQGSLLRVSFTTGDLVKNVQQQQLQQQRQPREQYQEQLSNLPHPTYPVRPALPSPCRARCPTCSRLQGLPCSSPCHVWEDPAAALRWSWDAQGGPSPTCRNG